MNSWPLVPLGDVFEIARGGSPRPIHDYLTEDSNGVNWISISDASDSSKYIEHTKRRIRPEGVRRSRLVRPGDFLLTNSMSFGRPYIMRTTGCIHDGWLALGKKRDDIDHDFFFHLLGSDSMYAEFSRLAAGVTVKNLNIDLVQGVRVRIPPLREQRRIAEVLDRAETLRAQRRQALAQLDTLAESIFLDMFGDPVSNARQWPEVELMDVGDVQGGLQLSASRGSLPIQVPYLRVANVHRNRLDLTEIKVFRATAAELTRTRLHAGDLLIVEGHGNAEEIGRCALWDGSVAECSHQNHLIRLRTNLRVAVPLYLARFLNSAGGRRGLLSASNTTSGLNTISVSKVRSCRALLPPLQLQHSFATRLAAIEALKASHTTASAQLDTLFASLQHRAFRGEL